jgi:hypothetical protein
LGNASSPSGRPTNSLRCTAAKAGSSASHVEKIGEARRAVDERLHTPEPVVAPDEMRAYCWIGANPRHARHELRR